MNKNKNQWTCHHKQSLRMILELDIKLRQLTSKKKWMKHCGMLMLLRKAEVSNTMTHKSMSHVTATQISIWVTMLRWFFEMKLLQTKRFAWLRLCNRLECALLIGQCVSQLTLVRSKQCSKLSCSHLDRG